MGDTKICYLDTAVRSNNYITRLNVTMDYPLAMRIVQSLCNLYTKFHHLFWRKIPFSQKVGKRQSFQEFHGNKDVSLLFSDIIDCHNIGMGEASNDLCLFEEAVDKCIR